MATEYKEVEKQSKTLVLGAGASRSVSYAHLGEYPSPLDSDFFDLLQRLSPRRKDSSAVKFVLRQLESLPHEYRRSMERTFYTLHLRAYLSRKLGDDGKASTEEAIVRHFARCVQALLRKSHQKQVCQNHVKLFNKLHAQDAIISFNYDLVIERALRQIAESRSVTFGQWLYGLKKQPAGADLPVVLKLHGSSNWRLSNNRFDVLTKTWKDFGRAPGYLGHMGKGTVFPIFLPFWDKRIERQPWLSLWRNALSILQLAETLIVWGYSLPSTDVKAQQLFTLAKGIKRFRLCVIDPSNATRERWRELFSNAQYWEYHQIQDFLTYPPPWW